MHDPPKCARLLIGLLPFDFADDIPHGQRVDLFGCAMATTQKRQQRPLETLPQGGITGRRTGRRFGRRQLRPDGQIGKKQVGRMDSFGAADLQQCTVIGE